MEANAPLLTAVGLALCLIFVGVAAALCRMALRPGAEFEAEIKAPSGFVLSIRTRPSPGRQLPSGHSATEPEAPGDGRDAHKPRDAAPAQFRPTAQAVTRAQGRPQGRPPAPGR